MWHESFVCRVYVAPPRVPLMCAGIRACRRQAPSHPVTDGSALRAGSYIQSRSIFIHGVFIVAVLYFNVSSTNFNNLSD